MNLSDKIQSAILKSASMHSKLQAAAKRKKQDVDKDDCFHETGKLDEGKAKGAPIRDMSSWAKSHRSGIKNKSENQSGRHPGFASVQSKIQKEGYSKKVAGAILASRTRLASGVAHKSNPRLNRVKG